MLCIWWEYHTMCIWLYMIVSTHVQSIWLRSKRNTWNKYTTELITHPDAWPCGFNWEASGQSHTPCQSHDGVNQSTLHSCRKLGFGGSRHLEGRTMVRGESWKNAAVLKPFPMYVKSLWRPWYFYPNTAWSQALAFNDHGTYVLFVSWTNGILMELFPVVTHWEAKKLPGSTKYVNTG